MVYEELSLTYSGLPCMKNETSQHELTLLRTACRKIAVECS